MRYSSILDTIGNTPLVELKSFSPRQGVQIFAKLEGFNPSGSVKDRIAKLMIEEAEASGKIKPGSILLEPTSGNTGIALAMIARVKGYAFTAVMPDNVTQERRQMLELYGANIVYSDGASGSNGAVKLAQELASKDDRYVMLYQYGNEANPRAHYEGTAVELIKDLPDLDVFVAGLGTGGTLTGNARRLKEHNPAIKVVAAEPLQGDGVQGLRSLEDGFVPPVLDQSLCWINHYLMPKSLFPLEMLYAGHANLKIRRVSLLAHHVAPLFTLLCLLLQRWIVARSLSYSPMAVGST